MAQRYVTDLGLRLDPRIRGTPLASPGRRVAAFTLDAALLFVPSLIVALLASWAVLAVREPKALDALVAMISGRASTPEAGRQAMRDVIPLLVGYDMPGTPPAAAAAFAAGDTEGALEALGDRDLVIVLNAGDPLAPAQAGVIRVELQRLMPAGLRLAALYGVAALFFGWFTARRSGSTPGKRWLRIRVVKVDGGDLSLLASLERFAGYAQIPASLFTAVLDFWRDPNRRLPHDRLSGTLVVRVPPANPAPAARAATEGSSGATLTAPQREVEAESAHD